MEKILRIDVGAEGGPRATVGGLGEYAGLGGRGMTSSVVCKEVPPTCHPLGPENKLVISPGLMSGSAAPTSGRVSVGCKSPLTGTIKESNSGGTGAQALSRLGYAAVILEGERNGEDLYKVFISDKEIKVEKCNEWRGLANYDLICRIKADYGDKVSVFSIGTAGEMLMANSTIAVTDPEFRPSRHCGRGGVGAVMGSKGIKCIILDYENTKIRAPKNAELFKEANKKFAQGLQEHGVTGQGLPAYGTNVLVNVVNEAGGFPTRNFKEGRFVDAEKISGEVLAEMEKQRGGNPTHGCHRGCVIKCSGIFVDEDGKYVSKQPEYETVWAHGGNCGIADLDIIARMDYWDDNYGLDTIEMGAAIGVAMEAGVVQFGDAKGAMNLIHETGKGTHLGRILGAGAAVTGKCFGIERVPVVKGQAMPAYDPRAVKGQGVTYATSTMGADHTAGYCVTANLLGVGGKVDPLKADGQVELSRNLQIATAALDSTGWCVFIAFAILDQPETFQAMVDSINGLYGTSMTADDVAALGKKILKMEREFNEKAGFGPADDRIPMYMIREQLKPHNVTFDVSDAELDSVYSF